MKSIIKIAENWLQRSKKAQQTNYRLKISGLKALVEESELINVNLSTQVISSMKFFF